MDFERILLLLEIEERTRNHPALKMIYDTVMAELRDAATPKAEAEPELPMQRRA